MRRLLLGSLTAAMLLALAAPAFAHPSAPVDPTLPVDPTAASTDNVEYLGRFPEHAGTAGGRLGPDGDLYYLTDPRGVYVYDVSDPESPELLGSLSIYQTTWSAPVAGGPGTGGVLAQEAPDTDGQVLLVDGSSSPFGEAELQVVDVSDPTDLQVLSTVDVTDHTWTCVTGVLTNGEDSGCAYAYGRTGHIIDLTDPTDAQLAEVTWREAVDHGERSNNPYVHDLTEIAPGLVMSAGASAILMDTTDPLVPVRLAAIEQLGRFSSLGYHSVEWANDGRDPFVVLGTEIAPPPGTGGISAGSDCVGENSVIEVWDASEIVAGLEAYEEGASVEEAFGDAEFHKLDAFDAGGRGIFLQGQSPGNVLYCAHWMKLHPDFDAGGLMAISYYDRGTRFVEVDADGTMSEIGWMVAADSYSGAPYWVTDEIVAIHDYRRGMEFVRLTGEEATGVSEGPAKAAEGSAYVAPSILDLEMTSGVALGFFGLLLFAVERRARRRR